MLFLSFFQTVESSIKEKIILNLEKTNNLTFNFEQKIEDIRCYHPIFRDKHLRC